MMNSDVGALAHEIPYWGWVTERTCLTLSGELLTVGALTPVAVDGRSAADLDAGVRALATDVVGAPGRHAADLDCRTRPVGFPDPPPGSGTLRRSRSASGTLPDGPCARGVGPCGLVFQSSAAARGRASHGRGGWWRARADHWRQRRRTPHESIYLAADLDRAVKNHESLVAASVARVTDATPVAVLPAVEAAECCTAWSTAGSGRGRRDADRCRGELAHGRRGPGGGAGRVACRRGTVRRVVVRGAPGDRHRERAGACTAGYQAP